MQKTKLINFRPVLLFALAMIVADFLAIRVFVSQTSRMIILISLVSIFFILILFKFIFKSKFIFGIVIAIIAFIIPFISVYFKANRINENFRLNVENSEIGGKIYKINKNLDKNYVDVYLTDVELSVKNDSLKFYGNYLIRVNSNNFDISKLTNGGYVSVYATQKLFSLDSGNMSDISYISRDIMGMSYVYSHQFNIKDKFEPTLRDSIREGVYDKFEKTDTFFTNVGFAMLFGDTSALDDSVYNVFELSGTVHLLAVSGFHISLIVAFLLFVFKKLRANNYLSLCLTAVVLIFYAYLCNFSASVVRASMMSLLSMLALIRNKECDRFSSLSLAAIFILLINPVDLFNISFVLSFVSVLSILLLKPIFERTLSKFMNDKFASSLSLSLSVSIGITIFQLYYFGKAPVLSFISNIITVPIVSILFIFLIASILIGSIVGFVIPLIELFGMGMKYVLQFNNWIASSGLYLVVNYVREIALVLSVLLMLTLSDYLFIKRKNKALLASLIGVIVVALLIF